MFIIITVYLLMYNYAELTVSTMYVYNIYYYIVVIGEGIGCLFMTKYYLFIYFSKSTAILPLLQSNGCRMYGNQNVSFENKVFSE